MLVSEYRRGFADNDHATVQNTGVLDGRPIHIDVGQFVRNERVKEPRLFHQELFNKTWKFQLAGAAPSVPGAASRDTA